MPEPHAAYHGLVYAEGEHSAVLLDARSGGDLLTDLTVAPDQVRPGFGVVKDMDALTAYPAIG
jgi:hypothetical protein